MHFDEVSVFACETIKYHTPPCWYNTSSINAYKIDNIIVIAFSNVGEIDVSLKAFYSLFAFMDSIGPPTLKQSTLLNLCLFRVFFQIMS